MGFKGGFDLYEALPSQNWLQRLQRIQGEGATESRAAEAKSGVADCKTKEPILPKPGEGDQVRSGYGNRERGCVRY